VASSSWAIARMSGSDSASMALAFGDAFLDLAVVAEFFDRRLHVAVLLGDGLETSSGPGQA